MRQGGRTLLRTEGSRYQNRGQVIAVKKEQAARFSEEMEQYRRALSHFALQGDWAAFRSRAGSLFDYVETVETAERERRFFLLFGAVLAVLIAAVVAIVGIEPGVHPKWPHYRNLLVLMSALGSSFEVYFFINFRLYTDERMLCCKQRREVFLQGIESDFRRKFADPAASGR
jgi:hypothetical protein